MASRYTKEWPSISALVTDYAGEFATYFTDIKTALNERLKSPEWPRKLLATDLGSLGAGTTLLDVSAYDTFRATVGAAVTFEIANTDSNVDTPYQSQYISLAIQWAAGGSVTFNSTQIKFDQNNTVPTPDTTAGTVTVYQLWRIYNQGATLWYATMIGTGFPTS